MKVGISIKTIDNEVRIRQYSKLFTYFQKMRTCDHRRICKLLSRIFQISSIPHHTYRHQGINIHLGHVFSRVSFLLCMILPSQNHRSRQVDLCFVDFPSCVVTGCCFDFDQEGYTGVEGVVDQVNRGKRIQLRTAEERMRKLGNKTGMTR